MRVKDIVLISILTGLIAGILSYHYLVGTKVYVLIPEAVYGHSVRFRVPEDCACIRELILTEEGGFEIAYTNQTYQSVR